MFKCCTITRYILYLFQPCSCFSKKIQLHGEHGWSIKGKNSLLFRYHYTALLQINRLRRKSNDDSRNSCLQSFILSHWSVYHYQRLNCTYYHNMAVCISVAVVSTMVRQVMWSAKRAVNSFQLLLCPMTPFMGVSLCTACKYHY